MLKYGPGAEEVQKNIGCPGSHGEQCGPGGLKKKERRREKKWEGAGIYTFPVA